MILFPMIGEIYLSQSNRSLLKAKRSLGKMRQPVYHGRYQFTVADGPIKETVMKNHLHDLYNLGHNLANQWEGHGEQSSSHAFLGCVRLSLACSQVEPLGIKTQNRLQIMMNNPLAVTIANSTKMVFPPVVQMSFINFAPSIPSNPMFWR